ncbi:hypothetical protein CC79DRAFT_1372408 [Sarocladium strictum]
MATLGILLPALGASAKGFMACIDLIIFIEDIASVPERARNFVTLAKQVNCNLKHACNCYLECEDRLKKYHSPFHKAWIDESITSTERAINALDSLVPHDKDLSLKDRLTFLFQDYPKIVDHEKALNYSHATLLAAINAMHLIIFQPSPMPVQRSASVRSPLQPPGFQRMSTSSSSSSSNTLPSYVSTPLTEYGDGELGEKLGL